MTPEEIAASVVNAFTGDEYWINKDAAIEDVAAALCAYGDARAQAERERCEAIASRRAREWRDIAVENPTSPIAMNRWHEATDIAVLISNPGRDWFNVDGPAPFPNAKQPGD